ncbi:MAG TPA: PEGA domain-containing protein [Vicinamibacterales bacterium]|nr:PEGA domain-containing protein [Vicinamibacterales bacterium]
MSVPLPDHASTQSSSGFEDGLGRRALEFDRETGGMLERLVLRPELSAFEKVLVERIALVAALEDERFPRPRAAERQDDRLTVLSEYVAGRRLSDIIEAAADHGIVAGLDAALGLLLEILPALSRLHEAGLAHGALAPGRVVITPAGQLALLDAIYAEPLERLQLTRKRLWAEFRLAFPPTAGPARFDKAADLAHASIIAASLTVGRALQERDYPEGIPPLRNEIHEIAAIRGSKSFADAVDKYFAATLPLAGRRTTPTADEAAIDLRKLVRKELGINTCRAALLEFLQHVETADAERTVADAAERDRWIAAAADAVRREADRQQWADAAPAAKADAPSGRRGRAETERAERERIEADRVARERAEAEREERERAEQARREAERERAEAARREEERREAERRERERLEAERLEQERAARDRAEAERRERERLEAERLEQERIARERAEAERRERERLEAERLEKERIEKARLEAERRERERLEAERRERERLEAERLENERLERERLEAERRERERLEAERRERERLEAERREKERIEQARLEAERRERERLEAERRERERLEAERLERERIERERLEAERRERERLEAERRERERLEAERLERERIEQARLEAERIERERIEAERRERERLETERRERERLEAERREQERAEAERRERERAEQERAEAERLEQERREAEREQERAARARAEAERREQERLEAERRDKERAEKDRAAKEKARLEAEQREREQQPAAESDRQAPAVSKSGWLVPPNRAAAFEPVATEPEPKPAAPVKPYPIYVAPSDPPAWTPTPLPEAATQEEFLASLSQIRPPAPPPAPVPASSGSPIRLKVADERPAPSRAESRREPVAVPLSAAEAYEPFRPIEERRQIPWKLIAAGVILLAGGFAVFRGYGPSAAPMVETVKKVIPKSDAAPAELPPVGANVGRLVITTQPAGAKVSLDGKPAGETPLTIDAVKPGRHVIAIASSEGSARRTVRVEAGQVMTLDFPLYSGFAAISIPFVVQVSEGGKVLGTSESQILLSPGRHILRLVNKDLGYSAAETVEIVAGEVTRLDLDPQGRANINAAPWAEVWIDGEKAGETPLANVPIRLGVREIVFKNPQYPERKQTVTITAGAPATISVDFIK